VWPVLLAQVLPRPQLIFPSETWFFGIYLNFQWQKSLKNQYLPHSESKSYQINHQDLSNNTKGTFQLLRNFQLQFNLIFSEEIIQYSGTFAPHKSKHQGTKPMHPLLVKCFQKTPRTWSEASKHHGTKPMHPSLLRAFKRHQEHDLKHPNVMEPSPCTPACWELLKDPKNMIWSISVQWFS
jgi:hypothetical protein